MRMAVAENVHRHAAGEIEIAFAVGRLQPYALASLEGEVGARISRHQVRRHGTSAPHGTFEMNSAASRGRHEDCILLQRIGVSTRCNDSIKPRPTRRRQRTLLGKTPMGVLRLLRASRGIL